MIFSSQGKEYTSRSKKVVPEKVFKAVEKCCKDECCKKVNNVDQELFFKEFWQGGYDNQNTILKGLMIKKKLSTVEVNDQKRILWDYFFQSTTCRVKVCLDFLCCVLQIKRGRFKTIQQKLKSQESVHDQRGKKPPRILLTDELKNLILEHCSKIPHSEAHYSNSSLKSFDYPDLNFDILYKLFCQFYSEKTGKTEPPIKLATYIKYFNRYVPFTFSKPRTDVCNFCFEHKNDVEENAELKIHKENVEKYKVLKSTMMAEKRALRIEFDFGQNLPFPKIPVSDQFYRRLLWLHIFNAHVFNDNNQSNMYLFREGKFKKGGNTVCNFLLNTIKKELQEDLYNLIYLFSDATGGQNRNYLFLCFLSLLSKYLQIEIHHLYPVRGHSYCSCDRNFGLYGQKKKKVETIETVDEYIEIIKSARNPPFTIINENDIVVKDFETLIPKQVDVPKELRISEAVKIIYYPNGDVSVFNTYDGEPTTYKISSKIKFDDLLATEMASMIGISKEKKDDVTALLKYLSPDGQSAIREFLNSCVEKEKKESKTKKEIKTEALQKEVIEKKKKEVKDSLQEKMAKKNLKVASKSTRNKKNTNKASTNANKQKKKTPKIISF